MATLTDQEINENAYRQLKDSIKRDYPAGRFVAIDGGKIVADAATFDELDEMLNTLGKTSPDIMVVEAGVDYPEYFDILLPSLRS